MSHHKIHIEQLSYTYPSGRNALHDINIAIGHGESIALIGANGAGKSTLLKCLVGLLDNQKGKIQIGDMLLTDKTMKHIRKEIGYTFQDAEHQLFMNTVYDDVAFAPRQAGLDENQVKDLVEKALDMVDCRHLQNVAPYHLSGGEKRSIAIATILVLEPNILMMDEPSVALDPKSRRQLINRLKSFEHTKIIATHDLDMVAELCQRVIIMNNGQIIADGKASELLKDDNLLASCGLELPLGLQGIKWL